MYCTSFRKSNKKIKNTFWQRERERECGGKHTVTNTQTQNYNDRKKQQERTKNGIK